MLVNQSLWNGQSLRDSLLFVNEVGGDPNASSGSVFFFGMFWRVQNTKPQFRRLDV